MHVTQQGDALDGGFAHGLVECREPGLSFRHKPTYRSAMVNWDSPAQSAHFAPGCKQSEWLQPPF